MDNGRLRGGRGLPNAGGHCRRAGCIHQGAFRCLILQCSPTPRGRDAPCADFRRKRARRAGVLHAGCRAGNPRRIRRRRAGIGTNFFSSASTARPASIWPACARIPTTADAGCSAGISQKRRRRRATTCAISSASRPTDSLFGLHESVGLAQQDLCLSPPARRATAAVGQSVRR